MKAVPHLREISPIRQGWYKKVYFYLFLENPLRQFEDLIVWGECPPPGEYGGVPIITE